MNWKRLIKAFGVAVVCVSMMYAAVGVVIWTIITFGEAAILGMATIGVVGVITQGIYQNHL